MQLAALFVSLRDDLSERTAKHKQNERAIKALQEVVMAEQQARFNADNVTTQTYSTKDGKIRCYQEVREVAETTSISELRNYVLQNPAERIHLLQGRIASRACITEAAQHPGNALPGVEIKRKRTIKYQKV